MTGNVLQRNSLRARKGHGVGGAGEGVGTSQVVVTCGART